jgi:hypothetical protein
MNDPAGAFLIGPDNLEISRFTRGLNGLLVNTIEVDLVTARRLFLAKRHRNEQQGLKLICGLTNLIHGLDNCSASRRRCRRKRAQLIPSPH